MSEISERPLLAATGQATLLKVCGLLAVVGIAAVTAAGTLFNASHPLAGTTLLAIGAAVLLAALFTALRRIACPQCKTQWLQYALGKKDAGGWLQWLLTFTQCPKCGLSAKADPTNSGL